MSTKPMDEGMKLDHVAIAVTSIENALKHYELGLGFHVADIVTLEAHKVRVAMLPAGDSHVELLEATEPSSPIQKFLEKRGEGVHHLCFKVKNLEQKLKELKGAMMETVEGIPSLGYANRKIAFLHPKSTNGVLIELVEDPA